MLILALLLFHACVHVLHKTSIEKTFLAKCRVSLRQTLFIMETRDIHCACPNGCSLENKSVLSVCSLSVWLNCYKMYYVIYCIILLIIIIQPTYSEVNNLIVQL